MQLGKYSIPDPVVFLAPMAGVSDRPFRQICRRLGASATVAEMVTSESRLWVSAKSRHRMDHRGEPRPRIVQLLGNDPGALVGAARENVARGADIIDLNLGCPAKKVCRKAAGSALLGDEPLVRRLLEALTDALDVPVTLKMRLGLDRERLNAVRIAHIAESAGVAMLAVHGRTRACGYTGAADHDTIANIVDAVSIPVLANGDITDVAKARDVLDRTGAAGLMIGRAAQGRPWLPGQIRAALAGEPVPSAPTGSALIELILDHVAALHREYGPERGVRVARKHIGWYLEQSRPEIDRRPLLELTGAQVQLAALAAALASPGTAPSELPGPVPGAPTAVDRA